MGRRVKVWLVAVVLSGIGAARAPAQDVILSPSAVHDFGSVFLGETSPALVVTVENRGAAAHEVTDIRLGETTAFALDPAAGTTACGAVPLTLLPGASCTVEVVFAPDGQGAFTGTLFVHSDDPAAAILAATMVGEGQLHPEATIAVTPLSVDFATVTVGDAGGPLIVSIRNLGAPDLALDGMSLDNQRLFGLNVLTAGDHPCGGTTPTLAALESCTVGVSFSPDAEGVAQTVLHLRSNDPATPEVQVTVTGTGTPDSSGGGGGGCFLEALRRAPGPAR